MATYSKLQVPDGNPVAAVRTFLTSLLDESIVEAVFTPCEQGGTIMPALVRNADRLTAANPLSPAFPLNAARQLSRLTHGEGSGKVAAVLRPCEIRAFVELVKLNQGSLENLLVIGTDCLGAYDNRTCADLFSRMSPAEATLEFLQQHQPGISKEEQAAGIARACRACEFPEPEGADLVIGMIGRDVTDSLALISRTAKGEGVISRLGLTDGADPGPRDKALETLVRERTEFRDAMFEDVAGKTDTLEKLSDYLAGCVNCYNCRVACPVCYCRECVFATDVFDHKPWQLLNWAGKNGSIRMPTDTVFYHLTRLAHMSTACVGCGQCSNACPNDIGVMELFRMVASGTQDVFGYQAGRSPSEPAPLAVFREEEFLEVTRQEH
jgi:formate dehydrogenase subunit beta